MTALQPLPGNPYATRMLAQKAYTSCILLESSFLLVNWSGPLTLVSARLLGYLIIHAPTHSGHTYIMNEINSCNDNQEKLQTLAQFYINNFLHVCE